MKKNITFIQPGNVSTLAGNGVAGFQDGPSSVAQFNTPADVCDDGFGNIYVLDQNNYRIRLINTTTKQGSYLLLLFSFKNI